jgi:hypothetical protein
MTDINRSAFKPVNAWRVTFEESEGDRTWTEIFITVDAKCDFGQVAKFAQDYADATQVLLQGVVDAGIVEIINLDWKFSGG